MNRRNLNQVSEANALRYIPSTVLKPFGYTGIPALWIDDPNFDKTQLWIDMNVKFRKLFMKHRGLSYHVLWENAAMQCGAEWSAAYENATPEGYLILNVKMPNVRDTQIFEFHPARLPS